MTAPAVRIDPVLALMRRFAVDWLDRADESVPLEIMDAGYTIHIGGAALEGRDAYVVGTAAQLARFPGLTITVHDVAASTGGWVVLRFTEHGASVTGGEAAWRGIGLFRSDGARLLGNITEEDYLARRRQLVDGVPDVVDPPMVAPWTTVPADPDPAAEQAVRAWLGSDALEVDGVRFDDGRATAPLLDAASCEVGELFSAGDRVGFHAVARGRYLGGLPDADAAVGREVSVGMAGMVTVGAGGTITGHVVRDRAGLRRTLTGRTPKGTS